MCAGDDVLARFYGLAYTHFQRVQPAVVVCPFDRREMIFMALAAFQQGIPIVTIHSGDLSWEAATVDDLHRHALALYATVACCATEEAATTVRALRSAVRLPTDDRHVVVVGSIHLDDVVLSYEKCPAEPFDVVLYHPPTRDLEALDAELAQISALVNPDDTPARKAVLLNPNGDPGSDRIEAAFRRWAQAEPERMTYYERGVTREECLGLFARAETLIGNSSSFIYDGPLYRPPERIKLIGSRNRGRTPGSTQRGGSDRVVQVLERTLIYLAAGVALKA